MQRRNIVKSLRASVVVLSAVLVMNISAWAGATAVAKRDEAPAVPASASQAPIGNEKPTSEAPVAEPTLPIVVPSGQAGKEPPNPQTEVGPLEGVLAEPGDTSKVPVLSHIASSGAKLIEIGTVHGLRGILARKGEGFMLFQMAPDGEAVVAGLQADLSVSKLLTLVGGQVTELGTVHGLRGLFVRDGAQFQVFYATPMASG